MQRRGCTTIEVSLYTCASEDLSRTLAEELVVKGLELANTKEGLFVVQLPAKQGENLV